jgi:hypothetical protein
MNDTSANPIFVALLFILRCVVPLAILFGISYLLRKMGLVAVEAPEPPDESSSGAAEPTSPNETITSGMETSEANPNEPKTVENNKES